MYVCVYAICKNESKNIAKYLDAVKDADLIVINDTGSTDNTVELIEKYRKDNFIPQLYMMNISYTDWDFSVARNDTLDKAKSLIVNAKYSTNDWLFVSLDIDEFIEEGAINRMKSEVPSDIDTVWLYGISPNEGTSTYIDTKVHTWNFKWYRSIHEIIMHNTKKSKEWKRFNPKNPYRYYHYQDLSKPRDYYGMLQKAYEKDPNDIKTCTYLCWEAVLHKDYDNLVDYCKAAINNIYTNTDDEFYKDPQYEIQIYKYFAIYYKSKGMHQERVNSLLKAVEIINRGDFQDLRIIHYLLAEAYWEIDDKNASCKEYRKALDVKPIKGYWVEDASISDDDICSKLSTAYYYNDKIEYAFYYAVAALMKKPDNELYKNNLESIKAGYKHHILSDNK